MTTGELSKKASGTIAAMKRSLSSLKEGYLELVRERDEALRRTTDLNAKINAATALFQAFGEEPPKITATVLSFSSQATVTGMPTASAVVASTSVSGRRPRGALKGHIDEVLKNGPFKVAELRAEILRRYGVQYGLPSVYRVLKKGLADKAYIVRGRKWTLRK